MTTTAFSTRVQAALSAIDEETYTTGPDGARIPQSSAPLIIGTMLDLLDARPGHRVLEIGTGTGYSTALLTELVGKAGHVVSVEIDPALATRARHMLRADGRHNVELVNGDGRGGAPIMSDPFDRVIAWATVDEIPGEWTHQSAPGAIIVAPVSLTRLAKTHAVVRIRLGPDPSELIGETIIPGGFVEAHDEVLDQWLIPPRHVDALVRDDQGRPWWLSAHWLRAEGHQRLGRGLLQELITQSRTVTGPLTAAENGTDFYAYLLATRPSRLTTAALGDPSWRIGVTTSESAAFISAGDGQETIHTGGPEALHTLETWADKWRSVGRPGYQGLKLDLHRTEDGWTVRAEL